MDLSAELSSAERRRLQSLLVDALAPEPSSVTNSEIIASFLPLRVHESLLSGPRFLVEGERGAGKTALFRFMRALKPEDLVRVFPQAPVGLRWVSGFETHGDFPNPQALYDWAERASPQMMERAWFALLVATLARLMPDLALPTSVVDALRPLGKSPSDVALWAPGFDAVAGTAMAWVDALEHHLGASNATIIVAYDDLDMISRAADLRTAGRLCGALTATWITLSRRLRRIQARIFIRPDLADLTRSAATDASKLRDSSVTLHWSGEDVFRALLRRVGAQKELRDWLGRAPAAVEFSRRATLGWMPPSVLPPVPSQRQLPLAFGSHQERLSESTQKAFAERLLGATMGSGSNKGYTHTWILNHSADARGTALPRVTFNLIRKAADLAMVRGEGIHGLHLIGTAQLEGAQAEAGRQRLDELKEFHPVVRRLEALRGESLPKPFGEAAALLGRHPVEEDALGTDGEAAIRALMGIGVLVRRPPSRRRPGSVPSSDPASEEQRIDLPDLFRKALDCGRKGGPLQLSRPEAAHAGRDRGPGAG